VHSRTLRRDRIPESLSRSGRLAIAISRHPRESVAILMAGLATGAIFINALFLQNGPHPAPIFAMRAPAASAEVIAPPRPRVLETQPTPIPVPRRNDPIAELIAPSNRVLAVQRALAEYGYGQIKLTGAYGPETRAAIEKFESGHHMPVTGQISDRLVHEIIIMTGRSLD
jgi:hypothetical protein